MQPNEKDTSKVADKENESETKEIPEEKVGIFIPSEKWWNDTFQAGKGGEGWSGTIISISISLQT